MQKTAICACILFVAQHRALAQTAAGDEIQKPANAAAAAAVPRQQPFIPMTQAQRLRYYFNSTFSLSTLAVAAAGAGTLQLSGTETYTGGTTVAAGLLTLSGASAKLGTSNVTVQGTTAGTALQIQSGVTNAIVNTATLSLLGGGTAGVADRGYIDLGAGINETVNMLLLNGVVQGPGTYGSSASSATFKINEYFAGSGIVTVLIPEPAAAPRVTTRAARGSSWWARTCRSRRRPGRRPSVTWTSGTTGTPTSWFPCPPASAGP